MVINIREHWLILCTSAARTLPLARSLAEAGFTAWAPKETQKRRVGRGKTVETETAIMPGIVFARADHLNDLLAIRASPLAQHPSFSLFRHAGRIPLIKDGSLADLRKAEERAATKTRRSRRYIYPRGTRVRMDEPAFVGLVGIVEQATGKAAVVSFGGSFRITIASWLLRTDGVQDAQVAPTGSAADNQRAAGA